MDKTDSDQLITLLSEEIETLGAKVDKLTTMLIAVALTAGVALEDLEDLHRKVLADREEGRRQAEAQAAQEASAPSASTHRS